MAKRKKSEAEIIGELLGGLIKGITETLDEVNEYADAVNENAKLQEEIIEALKKYDYYK